METKSRYEVIADLEKQKRQLIQDKASLGDVIFAKERSIRELKRQLEDAEDELKQYKESIKEKQETADLLITSVEDALRRFDIQKKEHS